MQNITDHTSYWDHYAQGVADESREEALAAAFGWTQYDGHGPGAELLGQPHTALELGFGRGNAVAALAANGVQAHGIDLSSVQCAKARERWGELAGARFIEGDVLDYLARPGEPYDTVYSIWGALWFTDPEELLPLIRDRLAPGGRLVFSQAPAVPGSTGIQGMYGAGFKGRRTWIYRWAYEPEGWADILTKHGYRDIHAQVLAAPDPENVGTLIVEARS
ncbi:trans-aconitate 2-methyltransferase [Streptomyces sp. R21]|uniref:Trans-aconitate 2-methyltransferase n=1 Tax=Streptomyces sp. R21 TaxID=3238627 RepID=A0AB39NYK6_9ACTN